MHLQPIQTLSLEGDPSEFIETLLDEALENLQYSNWEVVDWENIFHSLPEVYDTIKQVMFDTQREKGYLDKLRVVKAGDHVYIKKIEELGGR